MINFLVNEKKRKEKDKSVLKSKDLPYRDAYQKISESFQGNNFSDHLRTTAFVKVRQKSKVSFQ